MFQLLGVMITVTILSWINSLIYYPELANSGPKIDRLAKLFPFIFMAYWLKGNTRYIYFLLSFYLLSIIIAFVLHPNFYNELVEGINGRRVNFGMKNAQYTSMFGGMGLITCLFALFHFMKYKIIENSIFKYMSIITLILASLFFTILFIVSQSRQVWFALTVTTLLLPMLISLIYNTKVNKYIYLSYLVILSSIFFILQTDFVKKRSSDELETIETIIDGNFDEIPMTSIGIRINSWVEAYAWIKTNPIFGADENAISEVISRSPKFSKELKQKYQHLHNYHIETLVAYGLLGLLGLYAVYVWLLISLKKAQQFSPHAKPFLLFASVFLTYWFIVNCFETMSGRGFGVFTHNIMFACCYTFYLTMSINEKKVESI